MTSEEIERQVARGQEFARQYKAGLISKDVFRAFLKGLPGYVVAIEIDDHIRLIDLDAIVTRRDFLMSKSPKCPSCGTRQVQLTSGAEHPAHWKCRMCKHKWVFEPPKPQS